MNALAIALAVMFALDVIVVLNIAIAKTRRERRERFEARARVELTDLVLPVLEDASACVELPAPGSARGAVALETIVGLIATLKGEAHNNLVDLLEENGYIGHAIRASRARNAQRRAHMASLLGGTHSIRAVARLLTLILKDPSPEVRIVAAESIGAIGYPPSLYVLIAAARDPARYQELRIANVLAHLGPVAVSSVEALLSENDSRLVSLALDILIDIGMLQKRELVINLLEHRSPEIRARAASLLGAVGAIEAVPALVFATRDPLWFVRLRIVKALGALGVPDSEPDSAGYFITLEHLLYDDSWFVRRNAAGTLAEAGPQGLHILRTVASDVARAALHLHQMQRGRRLQTVF